ncbi:MAG: S8 family serine peptidase [Candidatus Zixiibacteriota bacterium]
MKIVRTLLCSGIVAFIAVTAFSAERDYSVRFRTGTLKPPPLHSTAVISMRSASLKDKHAVIQFKNPVTGAERSRMKSEGIELISYLPNYAYTAKIHSSIDSSLVSAYRIRWFDSIKPEQKLAKLLELLPEAEWAKRGSNRVQFVVVLHGDEDLVYRAGQFAADFDAELVGMDVSTGALELIMHRDAYYRVAELDAVVWIDLVAPPAEIHNDLCRQNTGAEILQQIPYNLSGAGVRIAEWDGGLADDNHSDLAGRIVHGSSASIQNHATHVAGTVLGDGTASSGQYRGMAPSARIKSYLWWGGSSQMISEYTNAIVGFSATVSTNSWGLGVGDPATQLACEALMGEYRNECATLDNVVRGLANSPITICWSAGNQRGGSSSYCGSLGWTYLTVSPYATAKNLITVGAISSATDQMTSFSSWGPCQDGRLKPDVVGPGCAVTSCRAGSGYTTMCGTSMSCPATAGIVTLLQERYDDLFPSSPALLPSTYKGILMNTAIDLGNPGPDFAFGHGKVDGVAAIEKISDGSPSYVEAEISTGETHEYDVTFAGTKLKVTLVWDDPGGLASAAQALVNDLDLVLIDPFGGTELPWVLDTTSYPSNATRGEDHINNVETVEPDGAVPGLWKARVTGSNIPDGPQKYSLIFTPDSSNLPGNVFALAVFDGGDPQVDPGATTPVEFWVANVGSAADSVQIQISDDSGWLATTADTTLFLDVYDSVFFPLQATVPAPALAGDRDSIVCTVTSLVNAGIASEGQVVVTANAFYSIATSSIIGDTVASPQTFLFDVLVANNGNGSDLVTMTTGDSKGWQYLPSATTFSLPPMSDTTLQVSVSVPAELTHLDSNFVAVATTSTGGSGDTASFTLVVYNPYPPPSLLVPVDNYYTQERVVTFDWDDPGDSYSLLIASNQNMTSIEHQYTAISAPPFTMPIVDSLGNGAHYWAVRRFVGPDSSSLQLVPFEIIVDVDTPMTVAPSFPANSQIVGQIPINVNLVFGSKSQASTGSPEFNRIRFSQDSTFSSGIIVYDSIFSLNYLVTDTLPDGRWYWQALRADLAGNETPYSAAATFILDTQSPGVPTQLLPLDGDTLDLVQITLKWQAATPPPWEHAPEHFFVQLATDSLFFSVVLSQTSLVDSLVVDSNVLLAGNRYHWRVKTNDDAGHSSTYQSDPISFVYLNFVCGDINASGSGPDIVDLTYLVDYLFGGGPEPIPLAAGSLNCDSAVDVIDLTIIVDIIFGIGGTPCCL